MPAPRFVSDQPAPHRPELRRLLVVLVVLIAYVSLYPFRFRLEVPVIEPPWSQVDMLANVLLFLPFGLLARWLAGDGHDAGAAIRNRLALLLLAGSALAAGLQWLQLFIPGRLASLMDVGMNWIGLGLGAGLAPFFSPQRWQRWGRVWFDSRAGVLMLCWLAAQLSPFLPGPVVHAWERQRYLFSELPWQWSLLLTQALAWLILLTLFWPQLRRVYAVLLVGACLLVQPWLLGNMLRLEELLAPVLAALLFALGLRQPRLLLGLLLVFLLWRGLSPWRPMPFYSFHWQPFGGFVIAPIAVALATLAEKLFWYGALVELGRRAGWSMRRWLAVACLFLLAIELIQGWLPRHRAELTDPLLLLLMVAVFGSLSAPERQASEGALSDAPVSDGLASESSASESLASESSASAAPVDRH